MLDKAVRYLLDGDAAPDRSTADIWFLGMKLLGWGPKDEARARRRRRRRRRVYITTRRGSTTDLKFRRLPGRSRPRPAVFHAQVRCMYRAGFKPIRDLPSLASLPPPLSLLRLAHFSPLPLPPGTHHGHGEPERSPPPSPPPRAIRRITRVVREQHVLAPISFDNKQHNERHE